MTYQKFVVEIKQTQSAFEPTRKRAVQMLGDFWMSDRGTQFEKYIERMAFDLEENARLRRNRNKWL